MTGDTACITLYHYGNNGSIVSEEQNGRTSEYRYDLLNRQTYVKTLDGKIQENSYDGEDMRAGLTEDGLYHAYHQDEQGNNSLYHRREQAGKQVMILQKNI